MPESWLANTIAKSAATLAGSTAFRCINDPSGTPSSRKTDLTAIAAFLAANGNLVDDLSDTWNNAGTVFTALKMNVTNTASAAASRLMDLQVGGSSSVAAGVNSDIFLAGASGIRLHAVNTGTFDQYASGTTLVSRISGTGMTLRGNFSLSNSAPGSPDVTLERDAAEILARRRGTNAQTDRIYDTYTSATDYHRIAIGSARADLSNVSGASVVASGLIPDGAVLMGLTTKVTTALGTANGTTGYNVGDGSDADRWGAITGTALGTSSDNTNWTAGTIEAFTAAKDVTVTAVGGNFNGTGVIRVTAFFLRGECD